MSLWNKIVGFFKSTPELTNEGEKEKISAFFKKHFPNYFNNNEEMLTQIKDFFVDNKTDGLSSVYEAGSDTLLIQAERYKVFPEKICFIKRTFIVDGKNVDRYSLVIDGNIIDAIEVEKFILNQENNLEETIEINKKINSMTEEKKIKTNLLADILYHKKVDQLQMQKPVFLSDLVDKIESGNIPNIKGIKNIQNLKTAIDEDYQLFLDSKYAILEFDKYYKLFGDKSNKFKEPSDLMLVQMYKVYKKHQISKKSVVSQPEMDFPIFYTKNFEFQVDKGVALVEVINEKLGSLNKIEGFEQLSNPKKLAIYSKFINPAVKDTEVLNPLQYTKQQVSDILSKQNLDKTLSDFQEESKACIVNNNQPKNTTDMFFKTIQTT